MLTCKKTAKFPATDISILNELHKLDQHMFLGPFANENKQELKAGVRGGLPPPAKKELTAMPRGKCTGDDDDDV